jgi:transcription-repair coupling factor (superfamily II helicase)
VIALKHAFEAALRSDSLRRMAARLEEGCRVVHIAGLMGGVKALVIAQAILLERRPALVLTGSNAEAQDLAQELRFLLGLLNPSPPPIAHLPSLEVDPYRGLSPHPEISAARALALWQMLHGEPLVVVASARAAGVRLHAPQRFLSYCLEIKQGDDFAPERLREHLQQTGYIEDEPVTEPGEFSLRGGILDVFPPHRENPVRLEFFGDRLESMRVFDTESQRSVGVTGHVEIIPMREYCPTPERLRKWAESVPEHWSAPFLPHLAEEIALAGRGELFPAFEFLLPASDPLENSLFDYMPGSRLIVSDRDVLESTIEKHHAEFYERYVDRVEAHKAVLAPGQIYMTAEELRAEIARHPRLEVDELGIEREQGQPLYLSSQPVRKYHGNIHDLISDLNRFRESGEKVIFLFSNLGRAERMNDILNEYQIPAHLCRTEDDSLEQQPPLQDVLVLGVGHLHAGFFLPGSALRVISGQDVYDEADTGPPLRRFRRAQRNLFLSDFRDLKPGDYVVHIDHGIGQFCGLKSIGLQDGSKEFVLLAYHGDAKLYVPVERLDLIQKYSGVGGARPNLDRLGGTSWERTKTRIKKTMRDMAGELLKLYAQRQMVEGFGFSPDTAWQQEFEDAFEFELTPDQSDAISATKLDMEAQRPMDRLLCGDVGYGKTEVAMRAAFKAVMDGKQVAMLAPTTVLAFQHFITFSQRFTAFPVRIQLLSRFRSPKEQKQILEDLQFGRLDVIIGTHRLLSKDVGFKDLGLVIVDEEQRFGVTHKERLKALKTRVDVLTLSATPIPRTLNMALLGLRDMSTIETPPKNRLSILTSVLKYSPDVIRSAIEQELARKGQVYFLHNRVETIHSAAAMVQQLAPRARIGIAHGQMGERELERVMLSFVQDELDVLVATTIIENGLDIPRVNTIIINRADMYGLSQLYQLRGRVGRSDRRAYAYLLIPSDEALTDVARKRLAAIREFSDLGAGFRVAALDLEIRGAGNLLGAEQHGQIDAVGFDLYCQLLEHTVEELKGQKAEEEISTSLNLNLDIRIPEKYIADSSQRLRLYKRISSAGDEAELEVLQQEMIDRFGRYPEPVENLFRYASLRREALVLQIQSIEKQKGQIHFRFVDHSRVDARKLLLLVSRDKHASFSPQGLLTLDVPEMPPAQLFQTLHKLLDQIRQ